MLDRVLGRAGLKDRIDDLEAELRECREERDRLEERLEAESERRSEAVSARQEAQQRVNRLEDRIAQLEGEVERLESDGEDLAFRGRERIRGRRAADVLDRLASVEAGEEGALTAAIDDEIPDEVREAFSEQASLLERAAPCVAFTDDAGLVSAALSPPDQPDPFVAWDAEFRVDRERYLPTGRFALALVRADVFAIGEYDGRDRLDYRGFESEVKGRHSKGGFSQSRFERRRDQQVEAHLDRCREAIEDREADRLYVVGDRAAMEEFETEATATAAVDASGDPEEALEAAFRDFWSTRLYLL